jgi:hypothetical protein
MPAHNPQILEISSLSPIFLALFIIDGCLPINTLPSMPTRKGKDTE